MIENNLIEPQFIYVFKSNRRIILVQSVKMILVHPKCKTDTFQYYNSNITFLLLLPICIVIALNLFDFLYYFYTLNLSFFSVLLSQSFCSFSPLYIGNNYRKISKELISKVSKNNNNLILHILAVPILFWLALTLTHWNSFSDYLTSVSKPYGSIS